MPKNRQLTAEPNFGSFLTDRDLARIVVSAHALRRFVERLQPGIPGDSEVAHAMACLEELGFHNRSSSQHAELDRYRDWMAKQVQPHVMGLIRREGFWASRRPRWSPSATHADGHLQIGGMCLFPAARHGQRIVLATCTNGHGMTWQAAIKCGLIKVPRPFAEDMPTPTWSLARLLGSPRARRSWRKRR